MTYFVARVKLAYGRAAAAAIWLLHGRRIQSLELIRIGTEYGGWYCARALLRPDSAALCCGAGEDISFDVALNARWGLRVICVDPTPRSVKHVNALLAAIRAGKSMLIEAGPQSYETSGFREENFTFVPRAVWSSDGTLELFAPKDPAHVSYSAVNLQGTSELIEVRSSTIGALLAEFDVPQLALLKLDIEGAEYEVLRSMLRSEIMPGQLLIEFDQVNLPLTPLFWVELAGVISKLRDAGYRLVHRERANFVFVHRSVLPG